MAILALLVSCGKSGDKGELVQGGKWHPEKPYGMTLVPGGAFLWVNLMMMLLQYKTLQLKQ
jgi:hypothetical protein